MKKLPHVLSAIAFTLWLSACQTDEFPKNTSALESDLREAVAHAAPNGAGPAFFTMPESDDYAALPQDPRNPITAFKVQLGQMLFHETAIGRNPMGASAQEFSCASCHHAQGGFQACLAQGIGEGGVGFGLHGEGRHLNSAYPLNLVDVQPIRSPSAMNGAWQQVMLWNGQFGANGPNAGTEGSWTAGTPKENNYLGFDGLETQAIAGQNVHRLKVDPEWVNSVPQYKALFDAAFPDVPVPERYSRITAGLAIAAYERTLLANQSPWQRWLRGHDAAMNDLEKEGALLFFGKAGCSDCHTGPALNDMSFHALGMGDLQEGQYGAINVGPDKPEHLGRGGFTGRPEDRFKFKVPQLYNLTDSPFFGHGATFIRLRDVVAYKNQAVAQNPNVPAGQLSPKFKPLGLTESEIDALTRFLETALNDPNLDRYTPNRLPSDFCFPNNDAQSRIDRGCD